MHKANDRSIDRHKLLVNRLNLNIVGINQQLLSHAFGQNDAFSHMGHFDVVNSTNHTEEAGYLGQLRLRLSRFVD